MKFADPKNDIAFKKIFGDENKTKVLISFLNSILEFKNNKQIKKVTILNPYQVPQIKDLKNTILDIKALNQDNEEFIVEMQIEKDKNFAKRSLYYTSKSYVNQIKQAENYTKLKKVYFIGILNFAIFDTKSYISKHLIMDNITYKQELKDFEFNFIELAKFNVKLQDCNSLLKKWIYFIKNTKNFELIPKEYEDIEEFNIAFNTALMLNWNKQELEVYDYTSMQEGKRLSEIETARVDGIERGIEKGIEQIAKNLLDILDNETISLKTGLSLEFIQKLRE